MVHLLAVTGLRISEAIALRWPNAQLDGAEPQLRVRRAWVREQFVPPKSEHGRRTVPIPHGLVVALRAQRKRQDHAEGCCSRRRRARCSAAENLRRTVMPFAAEAGVPSLGSTPSATASRPR